MILIHIVNTGFSLFTFQLDQNGTKAVQFDLISTELFLLQFCVNNNNTSKHIAYITVVYPSFSEYIQLTYPRFVPLGTKQGKAIPTAPHNMVNTNTGATDAPILRFIRIINEREIRNRSKKLRIPTSGLGLRTENSFRTNSFEHGTGEKKLDRTDAPDNIPKIKDT
ncbi:hypothetical protein V1477_007970 [Vespula maculifrons]|uniref:Uncharacterized protein n=1 Tax=Vespula maculifrons TaxID=7453 RepID=A0ABD2CF73_VESMC